MTRAKQAPKPHKVRQRLPKRMPWLYSCAYCGLVQLRNEATQRALRQPCFARMELSEEEEKLDD